MIQRESRLRVADNSGAREVLCINTTGSGNRPLCWVWGTSSRVRSKTRNRGGTVGMHEVVRAVIVRTVKEYRRPDGSYIKFDDNACVIVADDGNPRGTRIFARSRVNCANESSTASYR